MIKPGETTRAEVIGWFGVPNQQGHDAEGNIVFAWTYSDSRSAGLHRKHFTQNLTVTLTNDIVKSSALLDGVEVRPKQFLP